MAKKILKDINLCKIANRKFNSMINKTEDNKFFAPEAILTDLLDEDEEKLNEFEVEMPNLHDRKKTLEGTNLKLNKDMDSSERTAKN